MCYWILSIICAKLFCPDHSVKNSGELMGDNTNDVKISGLMGGTHIKSITVLTTYSKLFSEKSHFKSI